MPFKMTPSPKDSEAITSITLKLAPVLKNEIIRRAELEDRNVSNFVCHWLERTFDQFDIVRTPWSTLTVPSKGGQAVHVDRRLPRLLRGEEPRPKSSKKPSKKARKK